MLWKTPSHAMQYPRRLFAALIDTNDLLTAVLSYNITIHPTVFQASTGGWCCSQQLFSSRAAHFRYCRFRTDLLRDVLRRTYRRTEAQGSHSLATDLPNQRLSSAACARLTNRMPSESYPMALLQALPTNVPCRYCPSLCHCR